ncbi:MAG: hypothetical protein BMS9Abin20_1046 [Acidimicrobiia bacterium]|nr:MAG: hypothetical protein BMS9Abin20_1046 [Acidimicrobiia bacterium]
MSSAERGSAVIGVALAGMVVVLIVAIGAVGAGVAAYAKAAAAADAAALAAAPVTFRPFGATGTPTEEAARFARANGARLVTCRCRVDRSWDTRTVDVTVARTVSVIGIGDVTVRATSRATFEPAALLEP